jgi:hypothetical protein
MHWHVHSLTPKMPTNVPHSQWQGHFRHLKNSILYKCCSSLKWLKFFLFVLGMSPLFALCLLKPWWLLISLGENCAKLNFNSGILEVIDKVERKFSRTNKFYAELGCLMRMHSVLQTLSTREWHGTWLAANNMPSMCC